MGDGNHQRVSGFLYIRKSNEQFFFSDMMSYGCTVLRGCWCDISILNAHAPVEERNDI
jgi:hypothetical protein